MENEKQEQQPNYIKLDYDLEEPEERVALVKKVIDSTPSERLTSYYIEQMIKYILKLDTIEERKQERSILTDNKKGHMSKRETSLEGLISKFEKGEDGVYNIITNDKNIIFSPKKGITDKDIEEIEPLRELTEAIETVKLQRFHASGRRAFLLSQQLKEMYQDRYEIKKAYKPPIYCTNLIKSFTKLDLDEKITITKEGKVESDGLINIYNPEHVSLLLCNYSKIKEQSWSDFSGDSKWIMMDLENATDLALKTKHPMYYDILIYKIDGMKNVDIQKKIEEDYGIKHTVEYISSLWRKKIPKLIAETAQEEYLTWYYTFKEKGQWKRCSRCGQIKLAHNRFFSKNKTSKDHFYSICKECRNKK